MPPWHGTAAKACDYSGLPHRRRDRDRGTYPICAACDLGGSSHSVETLHSVEISHAPRVPSFHLVQSFQDLW